MLTKDMVASAIKNGGATWSIETGKVMDFHFGYMVGVKGFDLELDNLNVDDLISKADKLISDNKDMMYKTYLGAWVSGGKIYIDLSMWVDNLPMAIALGKLHTQLEVYDFLNKKGVKVM